MKQLYLRVWLTVVAVLALFALASGWLFQHHLDQERERHGLHGGERLHALAELVARALPDAKAPQQEVEQELTQWSQRLRWPMALDDAQGRRIAASPSFARIQPEGSKGEIQTERMLRLTLEDGRTLWVVRPLRGPRANPELRTAGQRDLAMGPGESQGPAVERLGRAREPGHEHALIPGAAPLLPFLPPGSSSGTSFVVISVLLFAAVALGAYPVVRRLTRRLEDLQRGVERFGSGQLNLRVDESGRDEVARLAASFNRTAERIEALLKSSQSLLANASHELRSPLARLKLAMAMMESTQTGPARDKLRAEIDANLCELDALIEEVLLASRLQARSAQAGLRDDDLAPVDLLAIAAEESSRHGAQLLPSEQACIVKGDERLLRRALRNLLENARRYGGGEISVSVRRQSSAVTHAEALNRQAPAHEAASAAPSSSATSFATSFASSSTISPSHGPASAPATPLGHALPKSESSDWVLHVCDRGPGVPEDSRERIFEPFYRLPGHAEHEGGVGLGLALVRQIAQRHGGWAWCEPREGGGSCFGLRIPG